MADDRVPTRRRFLRFSLRTFFVLLTVLGVWLGLHLRATRRQEKIVAAIRDLGGFCTYDYQVASLRRTNKSATSPVPAWLLDTLGVDFFHDVSSAGFAYASFGDGPHEDARVGAENLKLLSGLPKLRRLSLIRKTKVSDADLAVIGELRKLEYLAVHNSREITDQGVAHLGRLTKLRFARLGKSRITDESLKTLAALPALEVLTLQDNHFTNKGLKYLQDKVKLRELYLGVGAVVIDDDGLACLQKLVNLEVLDLQKSAVKGPGLKHLRNLKKLRMLIVSGTQIDAEDLKAFQAAHPACKIFGP